MLALATGARRHVRDIPVFDRLGRSRCQPKRSCPDGPTPVSTICQGAFAKGWSAVGKMSVGPGILRGVKNTGEVPLMRYAIQAEGLVKRFGETIALDGVDLAVRPGRLLGLLGPNGAGKTTAVRILTTLLRPDAGHGRRSPGTTWSARPTRSAS